MDVQHTVPDGARDGMAPFARLPGGVEGVHGV